MILSIFFFNNLQAKNVFSQNVYILEKQPKTTMCKFDVAASQ